MFKSKNTNLISDNDAIEYENLQLTKYCEWKGCQAKGEYRAPTSREKLREFRFFCLKHIKEYNKAWDYFKGRTSDQIYREISDDAYWHRKTKKRINNFKIDDNLNIFEENKNTNGKKSNILKPNNNLISSYLEILEIENLSDVHQVKKQYKKMLKKFHPDINKCGSNEKIIKINESYSALIKFLRR